MSERIANDETGAAALLDWGEPLAIAFYPDHATKTEFVARMRALAAPREVYEIRRGEDALPLVDREALLIVEPEDEGLAVRFFDENRDRFSEGPARLLILLLQGGAGEKALGSAPALASFAREASFDVAPRPRRDEMREAFEQRFGMSPELWLTRWRTGEFADTLENNYALGEALALADPS
jgi:hypothetical protein